jgi:hypothetical protein
MDGRSSSQVDIFCSNVSFTAVGSLGSGFAATWEYPMSSSLVRTAFAALAVTTLAWPLAAEAQTQTKPKKEPTAAQMAARERQKKCSIEWKETKAAGKLEPGATWPKFWSACNTRLKGAKA